jgi:hypothetical protein
LNRAEPLADFGDLDQRAFEVGHPYFVAQSGARAKGFTLFAPSADIEGMIADLLTWFAGHPQNRRAYPRRRESFRCWYAEAGKWTPIAGIDISASGLGLLTPSEFPKEELDFRAVLSEKPILVRAKRVWSQPGTFQGKVAWRYGMRITGIAADDWDAIVRYCNGEEVNVENVAQKELELARLQPDDVARLIPQRLQQQLLEMLVERRRLAPLGERPPLVYYAYGGLVRRNGKMLHRLAINSRIENAATGEMEEFRTIFLFDEDGANISME